VSGTVTDADTVTAASVLTARAPSAESVKETAVVRVPEAAAAMSTPAVTVASAVPAAMGVAAVEVQDSTVPPEARLQDHGPPVGAAVKVSPAGRVAVNWGSPYAGPSAELSDAVRRSVYELPAAALEGVPAVSSWSAGDVVTLNSVDADEAR
jgi:hypothetical protein